MFRLYLKNFTDILRPMIKETTVFNNETIFELQNLKNECPEMPPNLVGHIKVIMESPSMKELEKKYSDLKAGGHGQPAECRSRHRVAIIIPYRYVFNILIISKI